MFPVDQLHGAVQQRHVLLDIAAGFANAEVQPHTLAIFRFKLARERIAEENLRDIVGRYMDPPLMAMALCDGEKSPIQAVDLAQPLLPLTPGIPDCP